MEKRTIEEVQELIVLKNKDLKEIRVENAKLVAAFRKNAEQRKQKLSEREELVVVLNELKAEAKEKVIKEREVKVAAKKAEKEKKTKKNIVVKKPPAASKKREKKVPEKIETPETLMELEIF